MNKVKKAVFTFASCMTGIAVMTIGFAFIAGYTAGSDSPVDVGEMFGTLVKNGRSQNETDTVDV